MLVLAEKQLFRVQESVSRRELRLVGTGAGHNPLL